MFSKYKSDQSLDYTIQAEMICYVIWCNLCVYWLFNFLWTNPYHSADMTVSRAVAAADQQYHSAGQTGNISSGTQPR